MRPDPSLVLGFEAWEGIPSYLNSAKALTACSIFEVPQTEILRIKQDRPDLALQISDQAITQLFQREQKLIDFRTKRLTQLLASALLRLSPDELIALDQGDIAGLISNSREQVNRAIADLKKRGVMTTKGRSWKKINDRTYLQKVSEGTTTDI